MTNAEKKKILGAYRWHDKQLKAYEAEIEELTLYRSPTLSGAPGSASQKDLSDIVSRYDQAFAKIDKEIKAKYAALDVINLALDEMTNETEKTVLVLRYIRGLTFDQVAGEMSYSLRHTLRIHGSALQHFMEDADGRE